MRTVRTKTSLLRSFILALLVILMSGIFHPTVPLPFFTGSSVLAYDHPLDDGHGRRADPEPDPDDEEEDGDEDDDGDDEDDDECSETGSPVFLQSGQLQLHYADLEIKGNLPIRIERTYSSRNKHNGLMGFHWSHTFDLRVIPITDGDTHDLLVRWPSGGMHRFVGQPDGTYSKPLSCPVEIEATATGYLLSYGRDSFYEFASDGILLRMYDRNDNEVVFHYNDSTGCLESVSTDRGDITITRGANGKIASITGPGGRTVAYIYDANGNLQTVTDPLGNVTTYVYDSSDRLTQIINPLGQQVLAVTYDSQARVSRLVDADGDFSYAYQDVATNLALGATATSSSVYSSYYAPSNAIDGSTGTYYLSAAWPSEAWLQVDFSSPVAINKVELVGYSTSYSTSGTLSFSNGYSQLINQTGGTDVIDVPIQTGVTWVRYHATTINYYYLTMRELRVFSGEGMTVKTDNTTGGSWTYTFDAHGFVARIQDPLGGTISKTFDSLKHLTSITDQNGNTTTYTYDASGNLLTETDPLGSTTTYTYNSQGLVETITDPLGVVTRYEYDTHGNRTREIRDYGGLLQCITQYTYDTAGNQTSKTDPLGNRTIYEYDAQGNLIRQTDALGNSITYMYNAFGSPSSMTDPLGNTTTFGYDTQGNLISVTDALGNTRQMTYNENGYRTSETDPKGNTTTYSYDKYGNLLTKTDANGNSITHTYDASGRLLSKTDAKGNTTNYAYDGLGRLILIRDALGGETHYSYDAAGNLTQIRNACNNSTSYVYNANNQRIREVNPTGDLIQYEYDAVGRRVTTILPNANRVSQSYDTLGRLIEVSDSSGGQTVSREYDLAGRLTKETRGNSETSQFVYDAVGNVIRKTHASGDSIDLTYDALGRITRMTDALGGESARTYDALGQLESVTDPKGNTTQFVRDGAGNLISYTMPEGKTTQFEYDAINRRIRKTYPDGTTVQWTYDENGNVATQTDQNGNVVQYNYDALNRKTQEYWPTSGRTNTINYDCVGRLQHVSNGASSSTYTYDASGRLVKAEQDGFETSYVYDSQDYSREIVYPGGFRVKEHRGAMGFIDAVELPDSSLRADYTRNNSGRITEVTYSTNLRFAYERDSSGLVGTVRHINGTQEVLVYDYSHDAQGIKQTKTDRLNPSKSEEYDYDETFFLAERRVGTLSGDHIPSPSEHESFTYDAAGNITQYETDGVDEVRVHNARDQLTQINTRSLSYDSVGNLVDDGERKYAYDEKGQLLQMKRKSDGQILIECEYDTLGRRVKKTSYVHSYKETRFVYDGQSFRVLAEVDSDGNTEKRFVWGVDISGKSQDGFGDTGGLLFMQDARGGAYYAYGYDDMGNVIALYDLNNGNSAAATYAYSAFGKTVSESGSIAASNPFRFSTRYFDSETGLTYYGYRYYHSGWGRWITPDPTGEQGSLNLYVFANNSPTNMIDVLGLAPKKVLQCASLEVGIPGMSDSITWSLGPVWAEAGYSVKVSGQVCTVCCHDNTIKTDYEVALTATGSLKVVGVSYGGKYVVPGIEIEAWFGLRGELFASISGKAALASDMCSGKIAKGVLCFSGSAGGSLKIGAALEYEIEIWPFDPIKGRAGAYGELTGQFTIKRCADVIYQNGLGLDWKPAEICANASASVKVILPLGIDFAWTFWQAESCHKL